MDITSEEFKKLMTIFGVGTTPSTLTPEEWQLVHSALQELGYHRSEQFAEQIRHERTVTEMRQRLTAPTPSNPTGQPATSKRSEKLVELTKRWMDDLGWNGTEKDDSDER